MNKTIPFLIAVALSAHAFADDDKHDMNHDHGAEHTHGADQEHGTHDHGAMAHDHDHDMAMKSATITHTDEIHAALASGGAPVVVDVLGVVCDFCATAMNKIFGKRDEIAAVYVDLDKKTLSLGRRGSRFCGISLSARPSIANLVGNVNRNASSLREILTLLPISLPNSNAKARDSASFTLLPKGK